MRRRATTRAPRRLRRILHATDFSPAVLGHVQRGGSPTPFDRILATRFGTSAVAALVDGESGGMVALRGDRIERVALADALSRPKRVDPQGERVAAARSIGTIFGDETRTRP